MTVPPSLTGGFHEMTSEPDPGATVTVWGAPGGATGTPGESEATGQLESVAPTDTTETEYEIPSIRPLIVQVICDVLQVKPPGDVVATYDATSGPAVELGAIHDTTRASGAGTT